MLSKCWNQCKPNSECIGKGIRASAAIKQRVESIKRTINLKDLCLPRIDGRFSSITASQMCMFEFLHFIIFSWRIIQRHLLTYYVGAECENDIIT